MRLGNTAVLLIFFLGFSPAQADVSIAVVGPLTGQAIFRGEQVQRGAQSAVGAVNTSGGLLGDHVELIALDDACDPERAVAVANKLVSERILFVVGHVCSHASIPASEVYEDAGILMISPASTNPQLTDQGKRLIFRVTGRDDQQAQAAVELVLSHWGGSPIALVHDGTVYGAGLANQVRDGLEQVGIAPVLDETISPGKSDYSAFVEALQASGAEVLYFGGYPAEAGLILREAAYRGFEIQLVGGDSLTTEEFWLVAGPSAEGTLFTFNPDPRNTLEASGVVEAFRSSGFEPAGYTLHSYAAVQAWAEAVRRAGTTDPARIAETLRGGSYDTVLGTIRFDAKGDIIDPSFRWYAWSKGDYAELGLK